MLGYDLIDVHVARSLAQDQVVILACGGVHNIFYVDLNTWRNQNESRRILKNREYP